LASRKKSKADQLQVELTEVNKRIEKLTDAIEKGLDPSHLNSRFEKLHSKRLQLEDELRAEMRCHTSRDDTDRIADEALSYLDRLESIIKKCSSEEMKDVLKILVNRISVDPTARKVTCIFYKLPIPRKEDCFGLEVPEAGTYLKPTHTEYVEKAFTVPARL